MYAALRGLLFALDAERAHRLTFAALDAARAVGVLRWITRRPSALPVRAFGLDFPNPVGLAAGLDKGAAHVDALAMLGFGFLEFGTITPRPQPGNPRPRLFRIPEHAALINRMGFNNAGLDVAVRNLDRVRWSGVLGVNIGRNKTTPNEHATDDYLACLRGVYARASYVTVNVSSPNTPGLRALQQADALRHLLAMLADAREQLATRHGARKPLLLKIAPDLDDAQMDAIAEALTGSGVDGLVCTNTTLDRSGVAGAPHAEETGGLSGRPLYGRSTDVLRGMARRLGGEMPLIGVGGILSGRDAAGKIAAGASLVQLFTGLVYRGPALIHECVAAIRAHREASGVH